MVTNEGGALSGVQDKILIADDGTLFLAGGRHQVVRLFTGEIVPSDASKRAFVENIKQRQDYCERRGIHYEAFVFPDKMPLLGHMLPFETESLFESSYKLPPGLKCHYLKQELAACVQPFPKTDTHYSVEGNHACARRIAAPLFSDRLNDFDAFIASNQKLKKEFCGDLGSKQDPPPTEVTAVLRRPSTLSVETNGVRDGNDGLMMIATNPEAVSDKQLLLFADSYFRALIPYMAYFFSSVVFCRTRFFHYELVDAIAPDVIFSGMAERYLSNCLSDEKRPHYLAYPLLKGKASSPSEGFGQLFGSIVQSDKLAGHATWRD